MIHRRTHPKFVDGCPACRWASVGVAPTAVGSEEARSLHAMERRWNRDMPAYKQLRDQGIQPERIDGCADLAARATTKMEIETGGKFREIPASLELS